MHMFMHAILRNITCAWRMFTSELRRGLRALEWIIKFVATCVILSIGEGHEYRPFSYAKRSWDFFIF